MASTSPLRKWVGRLWLPLAFAVLVGYVFRTVNPNIELTEPSLEAPTFERATLDGPVFDLAAEQGRPVVVNFWATWCPPCRAEVPGFVDLQNEFGDDVVFVGVSLDDGGFDTIRPFAEQHGVNYPLVMDRARIFSDYGGRATVPTTVIVDPDGYIRYAHEGIITKRSLRPALQQLVDGNKGRPHG
jgi:thiol-disulfide isomerase/thioredoxin